LELGLDESVEFFGGVLGLGRRGEKQADGEDSGSGGEAQGFHSDTHDGGKRWIRSFRKRFSQANLSYKWGEIEFLEKGGKGRKVAR
jgi:hypothetical protein